MAAIKCKNRTVCCDGDGNEALANFSMEAPDPNRFLSNNPGGYGNPGNPNQPPLGNQWGALGCSGWCWSETSQSDAILCALSQQETCVVDPPGTNNPGTPGGGPNGNSGWTDPDGKQTQLFGNAAQTCNVLCPDGSTFTYTLPAGSILATNQHYADKQAHGFACKVAAERALCFINISPLTSGCPGAAYELQLTVKGGVAPIVWTIFGGFLPPGLAMSSTGLISGVIDASASGDYTVTVRVTDADGTIRQKNLVIGVCGSTDSSPLTGYTVGEAYSDFVTGISTVGCGLGTQTFALVGDLPPGLSLNTSTGEIHGTPTESASGDYTFNVQFSTAQSSCAKEFTIPEGAVELVSIEVLPANPSIDPAATQQFQALGHYSDATIVDITADVVWASDTPATATIDSAGLATGVATGTTLITATLDVIVGNTTLTVNYACGINPSTFATMVWTYVPPPGLGPPCVDETITGDAGVWNFDFDHAACFAIQDSVDASATICNPGAAYAFTVTIPWSKSGTLQLAGPIPDPNLTFRLEINGVLQEQVQPTLIGAPVTPVVLHGTIPAASVNTMRLYFVMRADPLPSFESHGTISIA